MIGLVSGYFVSYNFLIHVMAYQKLIPDLATRRSPDLATGRGPDIIEMIPVVTRNWQANNLNACDCCDYECTAYTIFRKITTRDIYIICGRCVRIADSVPRVEYPDGSIWYHSDGTGCLNVPDDLKDQFPTRHKL